MSAIFALLAKDAAHLLSDGGVWSPDFKLVGVQRKVRQLGPHTIAVGRGDVATLNALWEDAPCDPAQLAARLAQVARPGSTAEVWIATWPAQIWCARADGTCERMTMPYLSPFPDSRHWANCGARKIFDPDFDPATDGLAVFEAMRATRSRPIQGGNLLYGVAGHCELGTVNRDGASARLLRQWDAHHFTNLGGAVDLTNRTLIIDSNENNVNCRTRHDQVYPVITNPAGISLTIIVNASVKVGSTSRLLPALDIGTFPVGLTINLIVRGKLEGAGGKGDNAGGAPAEAGGTALKTTMAINLTDLTGAIWGGGGGGGRGLPYDGGGGQGGTPGGGGGAGIIAGPGGTTAHTAAIGWGNGQPGTETAGGAGGIVTNGVTSSVGGVGGGPGLAGASVVPPFGGTGGAAGKSIEGIANVTTISGPGDRRGPTS
jgi:hypothetical protein